MLQLTVVQKTKTDFNTTVNKLDFGGGGGAGGGYRIQFASAFWIS